MKKKGKKMLKILQNSE